MKVLNDEFKKSWKRGLTVLAINEDKAQGRAHTKAIIIELGLKYPNLLDPDQSVLKKYNPKLSMPYLVIVDRSGRIRYKKEGYDPSMQKDIQTLIEKLLKEPAP